MTYLTSWLIAPEKKPDLTHDDWHHGFADACESRFPQHPSNRAYMGGWLQALGMKVAHDGDLPAVDEKAYLDGYWQVQHERS